MGTNTDAGMDIKRPLGWISNIAKSYQISKSLIRYSIYYCSPLSSIQYQRFRYEAESEMTHHGYWTARNIASPRPYFRQDSPERWSAQANFLHSIRSRRRGELHTYLMCQWTRQLIIWTSITTCIRSKYLWSLCWMLYINIFSASS
jgi:hypothetical protein